MAYVMDLKKTCPKCGKKRAVGISDALRIKKLGKMAAEREYCFCS